MDTLENAVFQPHTEIKDIRDKSLIDPDKSAKKSGKSAMDDLDLAKMLDTYSLEAIIELKISRFLDQIGTFYPENLYAMIMKESEKPLLNQILKRTGGNQVHASKILGINRNTLRKKMKTYGFR